MAKIRQDCWLSKNHWPQVSGILAQLRCGQDVFAAHKRRECRSRSTHSPERSGLLRVACAFRACSKLTSRQPLRRTFIAALLLPLLLAWAARAQTPINVVTGQYDTFRSGSNRPS
jgi:hypothetical protein